MKKLSFLFIISYFFFTSCEKVIEVDLNDSDPRIVIEAQLTEGEQEFAVTITQTADYFDNQPIPVIDDAVIYLITEDGTRTFVPFIRGGFYATSFEATPNQTYTLEVTIGETIYEATSFLPAKVELIELETEFQEATGPIDEGYLVYSRFVDDPAITNYYRLQHLVDGILQNEGEDIQVVDDNLFNGGIARLPLFRKVFDSGETIEVVLQHFDEASYDYFNSLVDIVSNEGGPGGGSAAPGNPNSNWSNGALGYFSAFSADTLSVQIP